MDPTSSPSPETVREVELKFRVPGVFTLPELVEVGGPVTRVSRQAVREMTAIYYDTADLRLFRWGVTLRRRVGGIDAGWHLKLPVKGERDGARDELQLPLSAGEPGEVPEALSMIVAPFVRNAALAPVAEVQNTRTPYLLFTEGSDVASIELVDDRVSIVKDGDILERFRELEIEALVPDAPLDAVSDLLKQAGAATSSLSKAAAALGARGGESADVPEPLDAGPNDPASEAITSFITKHVRAFILQDVRVRRDLPDSVHQMRVAARRLRSGLKAFGPLVDENWANHLRTELAWAASSLGAARDTEVLLERLDSHAEHLGARDAQLVRALIDPQLQARMQTAREVALAALTTKRHLQLLDSLVAAVHHPQLTELADERSKDILPELVDRSFRRLNRRVKLLELEGPAAEWHEARISAKRARYSAEAVTGVFGASAKRLADALSDVTEILGDHQDACIAQDVLRELADSSEIDGKTGFALGLLHEYEFETEVHNRLEFQQVWPRVKRIHKHTKLA